jgi:Lon protease-like protein
MAGDDTRLPLVPLPDVVHFPRTELKLHVIDPTYLPLVHELEGQDEDSRWLGVVLLKPGPRLDPQGRLEIFPGGTAARVLDLETRPDGNTDLLLYGELRFELKREIGDAPYRQAVVRLMEEPWLDERDAGIVAVRQDLLELLRALAAEQGEQLPWDIEDLASLTGSGAFEELVNRIAARMDVPPLRKLQLLTESLPERGLSVLSILRGRRQVFDMLRPFRRLAGGSEHN